MDLEEIPVLDIYLNMYVSEFCCCFCIVSRFVLCVCVFFLLFFFSLNTTFKQVLTEGHVHAHTLCIAYNYLKPNLN